MQTFLFQAWLTMLELAPWLLLGTAISGLIHVMLPRGVLHRHFQGRAGVVRAVLWGIPLPLCSCGVIPAGIGMKKEGASDGASIGFMISTPQTGVDSILVSASFLGWAFAIYKVFSAFIMGIVGGWLVDTISPVRAPLAFDESASTEHPLPKTLIWQVRSGWNHALEILQSIWGWLLFGILVSAAISAWLPATWIQSLSQLGTWPAMLVVLTVSVPIYVCATASVPIAAALVSSGMPPSAALVFLIAGPATNVTTIGAIAGRFGWRNAVVYLASIIGGSMLLGWGFDQWFGVRVIETLHQHHEHGAWWQVASAALMMILLGYFAFQSLRRHVRRLVQRNQSGFHAPLVEMHVNGMNCQSCVASIEDGLGRLPQVQHVEVDLESGRLRVRGDVDRATLERAIRNIGFEPVLDQS